MRAQITTSVQDLEKLDFTNAKVENFYMIDIETGETISDEPLSFRQLRNKLFQSMYTVNLLSGKFPAVSTTNKGVSFHPTEFVGWCDGTGDGDEYNGVCLNLFVRDDSANVVMKDVFKSLPLLVCPVSIRIRLQDGRVVTINEGFPSHNSCGWKQDYVEFAKKFVMK
tara:strand:- start:1333 stop:1833 length:501 start_codon:yes stop_codon:yes gene_type:complete